MRAKIVQKSHVVFILLGALLILLFSHKSFYTLLSNGSYVTKFKGNDNIISVEEMPLLGTELYFPGAMPTSNETIESLLNTDRWIKIDDDAYIFSAYWETRVDPYAVRIVGIGLSEWKGEVAHLTCALRYNSTRSVITKVKVKTIPEGHGMKHTAILYLCATDEAPLQATLLVKSQKEMEWLNVRRIEPNEASKRKLAVCIQPMYGKFANNNLHLAEFINFYQLLNASHFTFYDYKADSSVMSLLSELSTGGVPIELLKWDLPDQVSDTWTQAQLASIVDCVYRNTQSHEYVFFADVDEFLVPRDNVTLQELIERLDKAGKWCSYMFRQSFFCIQLPDNSDANYTDVHLYTMKKVLRSRKIWKAYMRTKSIVRTSSVDVPGIHFVWSTIRHKNEIMIVNPEVAFLHHYRGGFDDECKDKVMDKSAVRYGSLIMNSEPIEVWRRWNTSSEHVKR